MTTLKKYNKLQIEVVYLEKDIVTASGTGGSEPWGGEDISINSIKKMNPLDRPLGIFKRD